MSDTTDIFKAATGEPDHKAIFDWLSPSLEPAAGSMGAPVWGGPDSSPSPMAQDFNHADRSVGTDTLTVDAVIANVANIGGTVQIDSTGERITGGKLTVTNPSGTVIIDGTSAMFRIAASGTISNTQNDSEGTISTTITALGALASTPAHQCFMGGTAAASANRRSNPLVVNAYTQKMWMASASGGVANAGALGIAGEAEAYTTLDGSNQCVLNLFYRNYAGAPFTVYCRYYIFQETAI